jgi:hypothetical protein
MVRKSLLCSLGGLRLLAQPTNVGVSSPSVGSGPSGTFSFTASSSGGYQNLASIEALFNGSSEKSVGGFALRCLIG